VADWTRPWGGPHLIDPYLPKLEELVGAEHGQSPRRCGGAANSKLLALGYVGSKRTTHRAVAQVERGAYRTVRATGAPAKTS